MSTVLDWCLTCLAHHEPGTGPCPPRGACPDCLAAEGELCAPDCPNRYESPDPPGDEPDDSD